MSFPANEPQTDREYMMQISGHLERLSGSIDRLGEVLDKIETKRIEPLEKRMDNIETWKSEIDGSWKVAGVITGLLTVISLIIGVYKALH